MLHRAGLCGALLCWVVFALSVSGSKKSSMYETVYDCLHKHICDCSFTLIQVFINACTVIDGFEKLTHEKFAEVANIKQSMDPVWRVICKEPKEVIMPVFGLLYDDLKVYEKNASRSMQRMRETTQLQVAKMCVMPLVARCMESGSSCF
ncbi:hypothetical protein JTE90_024154 [Oedothorax gibbosus]|uniref:Uncharacterized protein n=1 Tax=Oedothorax gibbosus TaxID=931172 RepID=A0AAV6U594_9ARAC|nr:hypothetical protein JTE90_024154 [Oedothorax gibbosus]